MQVMESIKLEYHAIIKFVFKERCNATTIHQRLLAVYVDCVPHYCTITRWFNEFKRGRQSLADDPRSRRPSDAINPISVAAV